MKTVELANVHLVPLKVNEEAPKGMTKKTLKSACLGLKKKKIKNGRKSGILSSFD